MNPRFWIAAAAVTVAMSATAYAETTNEVRAVTFSEDAGITRVHVRGAATPTFTVYKLERPTRVVIDLPHARLADALRGHESAALLQPNTWAVSTIAAQQLDDGAVRVIVTMARPGRYDVKTDGNEVVVMVMPRDAAPKTANPAELAAAKQAADAATRAAESANKTALQSKADAEAARAEAERLRMMAAQQAAKAEAAQRAVAQASAADIAKAKQEAAKAKDMAAKASADAETARKAAALAQIDADKQRIAAEQARRDAIAEAARAKSEAARAKSDAASAKQAAAEATKALEQSKVATATAQADAQKAKTEVERARLEMARTKAEADAAMREAERTRAEALAVKSAATATAQANALKAAATAQKAQADAQKAMTEAQRTKAEAEAAKRDAERTRAEALAAKSEAEAAKREAIAAKADAAKMMTDAKRQLTAIEQKAAAAQAMEDKARTALAAAQAREEAARDTATAAARERELAEVAMKKAQQARDNADAASRAKLVAELKAAEDRLAKARAATAEADAQRRTAEVAASTAKQDLEKSKSALATVESQRAVAVAAATDAARKRSEAESAASDAARKRREAEIAANEATKRKGQAESERATAEAQRVAAEQAARAAEKQRKIAEASAREALAAKREAEQSLAELTQKKQAAETAATEVTMRAKAQAKAEAEVAAAKARKAGNDEIAAARREVARLTEQRKQAETELAERRKAVAAQQSEAARLETAAAQARDAAAREEARKTQLAQQREEEERQLAKLKAAKVQAQVAAATPAPVPAPVVKPVVVAKVNNVTFRGNDATGVVELAMAGEGNVALGDISSTHVELVVDNAQLAQKLERTLDVSKFGSPVKKISSYNDRRSPNRVRLVAELASPAIPTVVRDRGVVRWRFASNAVAAAPKKLKTTNIPPTVVGGFGATSTPVTQQSVSQVPGGGNRGRRIYHGATVDFDFKDAPIHDLLRILADTGGVNIIVPDTIDAKVTVRLKRVPWDQALEVILASHGLGYRREGNLFRIAPRKELDAEDEAEAARRAAMIQAEAPKHEVVTLNYASADELRPKLEGMLSPKGKIEVDGRTNSLIINDVGFNRENIARLALQLDTQTPQITIEARIVEAQSTFVRQFGIQWGGRALAGPAGGNATGLIFPSSIGIRGGNTDGQTPENGINALPSDFAINLPAATGTGEGGAIGMSLGSVGGNFNINLRLSALEDTGTVRIVSAPKVTVLNNKAATIRSGVSIPISVVSAAGTQTQFVQADLKLEVTPYVSQRDCSIAMQLNVTKNEPDFVNTGARGDPTILRREAQTTMLVADGETSVLGGIYTRNSGLSYKKVPFFADLPVIGWFFKSRRENDTRTEILVFITPKITNKASLRCTQ